MSPEEQILENNKLIAIFMGGGYTEKIKPFYDEQWVNVPGIGNEMIKDLKYHLSYDWIMPVIEKIDEGFKDTLVFTEIIGNSCEISLMINHNWPEDKDTLAKYNLSNTPSKTKIESIYLAVVEYINWYNTIDDAHKH